MPTRIKYRFAIIQVNREFYLMSDFKSCCVQIDRQIISPFMNLTKKYQLSSTSNFSMKLPDIPADTCTQLKIHLLYLQFTLMLMSPAIWARSYLGTCHVCSYVLVTTPAMSLCIQIVVLPGKSTGTLLVMSLILCTDINMYQYMLTNF